MPPRLCVKLTLSRDTLELAVSALKTVATSTHAAAAEDVRPGRASTLRNHAEVLEAAAEEIRHELRRLDRDP